ncbi:MAG: CBS domain-containing protein [Candidatus Diapherotrites archaeon]
MLPDISEIKAKRKKAKLTQTELAKKTGISQSLIAKIEAGKVMPGYDKAKKIFDFFQSLHETSDLKALDIMTPKILYVKPESKVKEAIQIMAKNSISQLPVIENSQIVGTLSEKEVLERLKSEKDKEQLKETQVKDIMNESLPTIKEDTPIKAVSAILEHSEGVIVIKNNKPIGIITKADLFKILASK